MDLRQKYVPLSVLEIGMTLAKPLVLTERGRVTLRLQAGHILTDASIEQLAAHHAEYACIEEEDTRSEEERLATWQQEETRLAGIFQFADLDSPDISALYQALLSYRKSR
ncbi:MAG: hypothetical protein P4L87_12000 [Formivibrio sp.]|nr:hypothetical protein [Formivibrio sp.]